MLILAVDVDATCVSAAVLDTETSDVVGDIGRAEYAWHRPTPETAEIHPEHLWNAVINAAKQTTHFVAEAEAIGLTGISPIFILVDVHDRPLGSFGTYLDRRPRAVARQLCAGVGVEFLYATGNQPVPGGVSVVGYRYRLIDDPYVTHDVKRFLHLNSWLALCMTGETAIDPGNASRTGLYNTMSDQAWSPQWCEFFEVDLEWLPTVKSANETIGNLRSEVAGELGVPAGIPVKIGTDRVNSAALAAHVKPGELLHFVDEIQTLAMVTVLPQAHPQRILQRTGFGDAYLEMTHNLIGVNAFDWLHQLCFREQSAEEFFETTLVEAMRRETRVQFDPPYLAGDPLEIAANRAAFRELELSTDRMDLLAGLCDALVRGHRQALEELGPEFAFNRVVMIGDDEQKLARILPDYAGASVERITEPALRGVAQLFA